MARSNLRWSEDVDTVIGGRRAGLTAHWLSQGGGMRSASRVGFLGAGDEHAVAE